MKVERAVLDTSTLISAALPASTALAGEASLLVSGDRDLLDLGTIGELTIHTPAEALALLARR